MSGDQMPIGHEAVMLYFVDSNGDMRLASSAAPLPTTGGQSGGGTQSVQVVSAAIQNPTTCSTTPLDANAEVEGTWLENSFTQSHFTVAAASDVAGHLYLEASTDYGTTVFPVQDVAVPANGWGQLSLVMVGFPVQYRARYVNGPTPQTRFLLGHNATFS